MERGIIRHMRMRVCLVHTARQVGGREEELQSSRALEGDWGACSTTVVLHSAHRTAHGTRAPCVEASHASGSARNTPTAGNRG